MAKIRAVVFDVYKTLIDIQTDEESLGCYGFLSRWLSYHGVEIDGMILRQRYKELCREEFARSFDPYPDFDIGKVFSTMLLDAKLPNLDVASKSRELALLFRILTTKSISVRPGALQLINALKGKAKLGIVSNAQRLFTIPELSKFDLVDCFDAVAFSSDVGARKPDQKIFQSLLNAISVAPEAAVFVGDNMFDDVYGASSIGMKTVWINRDGKPADTEMIGFAKPDYEIRDESYETLSEILLSLL
jgi:putative hydrolase of the HAD superfamily